MIRSAHVTDALFLGLTALLVLTGFAFIGLAARLMERR
jgi:hypothetical protein